MLFHWVLGSFGLVLGVRVGVRVQVRFGGMVRVQVRVMVLGKRDFKLD